MARVAKDGNRETERETLRQEAIALARRLAAMVRQPKPASTAGAQDRMEQEGEPKPV